MARPVDGPTLRGMGPSSPPAAGPVRRQASPLVRAAPPPSVTDGDARKLIRVPLSSGPGRVMLRPAASPGRAPPLTTDPVPEFGYEFSTHLHLIELAHELPPIANKGDHSRLSDAASTLLEAFVRHAEDERYLVLRLPPFTARLVENGQQRVVDRLVSRPRGRSGREALPVLGAGRGGRLPHRDADRLRGVGPGRRLTAPSSGRPFPPTRG